MKKNESHVLVVSDSEVTRNDMAQELDKRGCFVTKVVDGIEAFGVIQALEGTDDAIDMVATDATVSDYNGAFLVNMLREDGYELPIALLLDKQLDRTDKAIINAKSSICLKHIKDIGNIVDKMIAMPGFTLDMRLSFS